MNNLKKFEVGIEKIEKSETHQITGGSGYASDTCKGTTQVILNSSYPDTREDGDYYPDC